MDTLLKETTLLSFSVFVRSNLFHLFKERIQFLRSCGTLHRRREVMNIGGGGGRFRIMCVWGGEGSEYWGGGGGGANFSLAVNWSEPPPQSVPNNYISHIEN